METDVMHHKVSERSNFFVRIMSPSNNYDLEKFTTQMLASIRMAQRKREQASIRFII